MKLKHKILLCTGVTLLCLLAVMGLTSYRIMLEETRHVENDYAVRNALRFREALNDEMERISSIADNWAARNDTYEFAGVRNMSYVEENLVDDAVANLSLNLILFFDSRGSLIYGTGFSCEGERKTPVPQEILGYFSPRNKFLSISPPDSRKGVLAAENSILLFSAMPILTGKSGGPARGTLILGRYLDEKLLAKMRRLVQRPVRIETADALPPDFTKALKSPDIGYDVRFGIIDKDKAACYFTVNDVNMKPAFAVRIENPRDIYGSETKHLRTLFFWLIISGAVFYLMISALLDKTLFGRIRRITNEINNIKTASDLSKRITGGGSDEIAAFAGEINSMLDVIERSRVDKQYAEITLLDTEKQYKLILEKSPIGIATCFLDGRIRTANPAYCEITGYSQAELAKMHFQDITHPDDLPFCLETFKKLTGGEMKSSVGFEKRYVRKDGKILNTLMNVSLHRDLLGDPQFHIATVMDITAHKKAEEDSRRLEAQLQQVQQLESMGRLAGGFAHDLNNLLVPILGFSDILLSDSETAGITRKGISEIRAAALRAKDLAQKMLAMSSSQMLGLKVFDLNGVISELKDFLQRLIREDIRMEFRLSPSPCVLNADPAQIEQVLINLVINAKDAMLKGGTLVIETKTVVFDRKEPGFYPELKPGSYVMFSVSDTGTGISPEILSHIFEPFFTTKEKGKGTGLGLSITLGIVKQHSGSISIETKPGKGTTFKVLLPASTAPLSPKDKTDDVPAGGKNETIMLVDDDTSVLNIISEELIKSGYRILESSSGRDALKISKEFKGRIDLLLTDVIMPEIDGKELYMKLSAERKNIKVLFMSGHAADVLSRHDISFDSADNFMRKPFTMDALRRKIREVIGK